MKYAIRDLFWLCLVVAISAGWLVDRQRQGWVFAQKQTALVTEIETVKAELETVKVKAKDLAWERDWTVAEYQTYKSRADKWLETLITRGVIPTPSNDPPRHPAD